MRSNENHAAGQSFVQQLNKQLGRCIRPRGSASFEIQPLEQRTYLSADSSFRPKVALHRIAESAAYTVSLGRQASLTQPAREGRARGAAGRGESHPVARATVHAAKPKLHSHPTKPSQGRTTHLSAGTESMYAVAVQKDGKIVVAGNAHGQGFAVTRYNADGTPDLSFGHRGTLAINVGGGSAMADAVALDYSGTPEINPNYGKILVAGTVRSEFAVARLNANGRLDKTFAKKGKAVDLISGRADALIIQPSGKVLVGGIDRSGPVSIRLNSNGTLDLSYGTHGVSRTAVGGMGGHLLHPSTCCGGGGGCCAPTVTPTTNSYTIIEQGTVTISGTITDNNPNSLQGTIYFGDQTSTTFTGSSFSIPHQYNEDGTDTVTISVTDTSDNESGIGYTTVTVSEAAPAINYSSGSVAEGFTFVTTGSVSTDGGDSLSATVNYGDGTGTQTLPLTNGNFTLSHEFTANGGEDNHTYSITVVANASDEGTTVSSTDTQSVTVAEATPIISGAYHAAVGTPYTLSFAQPDPNDVPTSWTVSWGDGSAPQTISGSPSTATHTFLDPAPTDVITATAADENNTASNHLPIAVQQGPVADAPMTNLNVEFQPYSGFNEGYNGDLGYVFGDHSDFYASTIDYCYGWNTDTSATAVVRYQGDTPAYRDTFIPLPTQNLDNTQNKWSVGLANGTYQITIVSGDPNVSSGWQNGQSYFYQTYANGVQMTNGSPSGGNGRWVTGTATVTVSNGWLNVYSGPAAANNVINMISITPATTNSPAPHFNAPTNLTAYAESTRTVDLNWTDNADYETGFQISRSVNNGSYSLLATTAPNQKFFADASVSAGTTYSYQVVALNGSNQTTAATASVVTPTSNGEAPYMGTAWPIASSGTSTIQAENFDRGGPGVAYSTNASFNWGGEYRDTDAGVGTGGPVEQGYYLGWNVGGNWYNYTINVAQAGQYRVDFRVACEGAGGQFAMNLDGGPLIAPQTIPDTGGWNMFQTIAVENVYLPAGQHVLTLRDTTLGDMAEGNYDWFAFTPEPAAPAPPINLYATPQSDSSVKLSWTHRDVTATGYEVLRAVPGGSFAQIGTTLPQNTSGYVDASASADTTYLYEIEAVNGYSPALTSNQATVRMPDAIGAAVVPAADAYVVSADPNTSYGNPATLQASNGKQRIFLNFDLSAFGSSVNAVKLRLFGTSPQPSGLLVNLYGLSSPPTWSESTITWANQPAVNSTPLSTATINTNSAHWYEWDLNMTNYVNDQLGAGHKLIGVMLEPTAATSSPAIFNSPLSLVNGPVLLVSTGSATIPTAPTNLVATAVSSSQINLQWTNTCTASNASVLLEYSTDDINWSTLATLSSTTTTYSNTGLSANTLRYYRVSSEIGGDDVGYSYAQATTWASSYSISGGVYDSELAPLNPLSNGSIDLQFLAGTQDESTAAIIHGGPMTYYPPDNSVLSANSGTSTVPPQLDEITHDGKVVPFAAAGTQVNGIGLESGLAVPAAGNMGGFSPTAVFISNSDNTRASDVADIIKIPGLNQDPIDPWVQLPSSHYITDLTFDTTGLFGGDLIALTDNGQIWLVDAAGHFAQLAQLPQSAGTYESILSLPNNPSLYGPCAGKLLVLSDGDPSPVYAVDVKGDAQVYGTLPSIAHARVIPADQNLYVSTVYALYGAPASDLSSYVGDILAVPEFYMNADAWPTGPLVLTWQNDKFTYKELHTTDNTLFINDQNAYERMGFAPAGVQNVLTTETPMGGVTITLSDPSGDTWTTTSATLDGSYSFVSGQSYNYNGGGPQVLTLQTNVNYTLTEQTISGYTEDAPLPSYSIAFGSQVTAVADRDFVNHRTVQNTNNTPPTITSSPPVSQIDPGEYMWQVAPNSTATYTVAASDPDNDPLTYNLYFPGLDQPSWITMSASHVITVSPPPIPGILNEYNPAVLVVSDGTSFAMQPFTVYIDKSSNGPAAPTGVHATSIFASTINLAWTAPPADSQDYPSSYMIVYGTDPSNLNQSASTGSTGCSIGGLAAGTVYYFQVLSVDGNGLESIGTPPLVSQETWLISNGFTISPPTLEATEGVAINSGSTIATFTGPSSSASNYTATINWGDGSPTVAGALANDPVSGIDVEVPSSGHTYARENNYPLSVTVSYTGTPPSSVTDTWNATVEDQPMTLTPITTPGQGLSSTFTQYQQFSGKVALLTDPQDHNATASQFSGYVDWGDGQSSPASFTSDPSGGFDVSATHTYRITSGNVPVQVYVWDTIGANAQIVSFGPPVPIIVGYATSLPSIDPPNVTALSPTVVEVQWPAQSWLNGYLLFRYTSATGGTGVEIPAQVDSGQLDFLTNGPYWDQGLSPGTTYYYALQGLGGTNLNDVQYTPLTSRVAVTTWGPPSTPSNVSATAASGNEIDITWNPASSNDHVQGWDVLRSTSSGGPFTSILDPGTVVTPPQSGNPSFADQTVQAGTTYYYEVVAVNTYEQRSDASSPPASAVALATGPQSLPPAPVLNAPADAGVLTSGLYQINLSWSEPTVLQNLSRFDVYRSTDSTFDTQTSLIGSSANDWFSDQLAAGTYYYRVEAVVAGGSAGEVSSPPSSTKSITVGSQYVTAPSAPGNAPSVSLELAPNPNSSSQDGGIYTGAVVVSWSEPSSSIEQQFDVYRVLVVNGQQPPFGTTPIGTVPAGVDTYTDPTAQPGLTYAYAYAPINSAVNLSNPPVSPSSSQITTPQSTVAAPINTSSQSIWATQNNSNTTGKSGYWTTKLTWTAEASANWYVVYRSTPSSGWVLVGQGQVTPSAGQSGSSQSPGTTFTIVDDNGGKGLDPGVTYSYIARVLDSSNNLSVPSAPVAVPVTAPGTTEQAPILELTSPAASSTPWNLAVNTAINGVVEAQVGRSLQWSMTLTPVGTGGNSSPITLAGNQTSGVGSVAGGAAPLAYLDPTRFPSGTYKLTITADYADNPTNTTVTITQAVKLNSNFKLSNLALPVTDGSFAVPGGRAVTVARDYDSQQVNVVSPDFGYGWRMDLWDTNLHTTAESSDGTYDISDPPGFRAGDLVYITLPGGQQHVFRFEPQVHDQEQSWVTSTQGQLVNTYYNQFVCVDGSGAQLTAPGYTQTKLQEDPQTGLFLDQVNKAEYNPANSLFSGDYTLTLKDHSSYTISTTTGLIATYADAFGNTTSYPTSSLQAGTTYVTFTPSGGPAQSILTITRTQMTIGGQTVYPITSISDSRTSGSIQYSYDSNGNLIGVTDRAGNPTTYAYSGELAVANTPNVTSMYAIVQNESNGEYWNPVSSQWQTGTSNWTQYAIGMTATTIGGPSWFTAAIPQVSQMDGAGTLTLLKVSYYHTNSTPSSSDAVEEVQQNLVAQISMPASSAESYLTAIINGVNSATLQAAYDSSTGALQNVYDANGDYAPITNGGFNGSSANEGGQGMIPPSGQTPANNPNTETVYDSHGNIARTIQEIKNASGGVTGYLITVHEYSYGAGDYNADSTTGLSNENALLSQTDWQPFTVPAPDTNGLRYTESPQAQAPTGTTWPHTLTSYEPLTPGDTLIGTSTTSEPWAFKPTSVVQFLNDGVTLTTTYSYVPQGSPVTSITETITDPYGNTTINTYDPSLTYLLSTTNAAGETTYNDYTTAANTASGQPYHGLPAGLLLDSYVMHGATKVYTVQNAYYTAAGNVSGPGLGFTTMDNNGGLAGALASSTNAALLTTYYTYYSNGMVDATYHLWTDPNNASNKQWVWSQNHYDENGRVIQVDTALYTDSSTTINASNNLVGYLKADVTHYNAAGLKDYTQTNYVDSNNTVQDTGYYDQYHYDAKGELVQTIYYDGTEVRSVYDTMGRVIWQTDRFDPTAGNPDGSNTVYDSLGRSIQSNRYTGVNIQVAADPNNVGFYDVSFTPPPAGNQISGTVTQYNDSQGRQSAVVGTDGQTTTTLYNANSPEQSVTHSQFVADVLADGALAYWRLGDAAGASAATDSSGNNNAGTYNNVTLGVSGALGGDPDTAGSFNGTSSTVMVPYSAALNTSQFSASVWCDPSSATGYECPLGNRNSANGSFRGWNIYAGSSGTWQFWLGIGSGWAVVDSGVSVAVNAWTHVAVTFDGTTASIYINGTLAKSTTVSGYEPNNSVPLSIGANDNGTDFFWPGKLDEVSVYNKALSTQQISALYAAAPLQASTTIAESDRFQIAVFTPGGTIGNGDQFTITLGPTSSQPQQSISFTATDSSLADVCNGLVNAIKNSTGPLFEGVTAAYDADSQTVHVVWNTADAQVPVSVSCIASMGDSPTFTYRLVHNTWQKDGNGNVTTTEYDPLNRTYRVDYPDGTFTETLYGVNGQGIPGHTVSGQTIAGYQEAQFDQLGNETDSFYDMSGNLTDEYQPPVSDPYATAAMTDAPAGYWRLDESSGTTAADSSGNGNNGTYNSISFGQTGALLGSSDTAAGFNGTSSSVDLGTNTAFDMTSNITLACWFKLGSVGGTQVLMTTGNNSSSGLCMYVDATGHLNLLLGGVATVAATGTLSTNTWYYAVLSRGTTSATLYLNGTAVATTTATPNSPAGSHKSIGADVQNGINYFSGEIDEAAIYSVALSAAQIGSQYSAGRGAVASAGNMAQPHWNYTYDIYGNESSQTDPNGNVTGYAYDALANQTSRTIPLEGTETLVYNYQFNQLDHSLDFKGNKIQYSYYAINQGKAGLVARMDYYLPGGGTLAEYLTYAYDDLNRLYQTYDSTNGWMTYYYDESGSAVTISPTTGAMTTVSGDLAGNLSSVSTPQGTVHYVYDAATNRLVETWTGTGAKTAATTDTLYGHDSFGRLASVTIAKQNGAAPTLTSSNTSYFDAKGDSITTSLPTTLYSYDADGNVTKVSYPNGTETDTSLSAYWTPQGGNVFGKEIITNMRGSTTLSSFTYGFDADRRKISDSEFMLDPNEGSSNTSLTTWTYDALSRLTREVYDFNSDDTLSGGAGQQASDFTASYTYDLVGNRMSKTVDQNNNGTIDQSIAYAYNAANQLTIETSTGSPAYVTRYSYDANGSTTQAVTTGSGAGTNSYVYDVRNRLINSTVGGTAASDTYDNDGNMVSQQIGSTTTTFLLDKHNPTGYSQTLEAWTGGSSPATTYTIGNSVLGQNVGGVMSFIMVDGQGSTRQLTFYNSLSTDGQVAARYDYDAFGSPIKFNPLRPANSTSTSILYQNEPIDAATGNYTMEVRQERPGIGRFTTQDMISPPLGSVVNADLYLFAASNPINLADPSGNDAAGAGAFGLANAVEAENIAGYIATSSYESAHFAQVGAYAAASFAMDDLLQTATAFDQQAAFALAGSVGASLGGLVAGFVSDLVYDGINALLYADESAGSAASEIAAAGVQEEAAIGSAGSAAGCFLAGTNVLLGDRKSEEPIQDIHVGQRVATDGGIANSTDGTTAAVNPNATRINRRTWRLVTMEIDERGANGIIDVVQIQALEPLSLLKREHAHKGVLVPVPLDLQEMGLLANDKARILSIVACPTIQPGPGRVVLTTVTHQSNFVFDLTIVNAQRQSATIGVTGLHPIYTEDRGWVAASELTMGEKIRGARGDATVSALVREPGLYKVYNMTVDADHVYYVGDLSLLVHNTCWGAKPPTPLGLGSTGRTAATSIKEQLAMETAMADPAAGTVLKRVTMNDARWPASAGWVKMSQNVNGIEIHYVMNRITGEVDDFKFK